jgi:double-stranded uracil-DNA glycosylase
MLPDYLAPRLRVVIVGTAAGDASAARGHYYAGRRHQFWKLLYSSELVPLPLTPDDDGSLPSHGIGLTDLVKTLAQSHDRGLRRHYAVHEFVDKVGHFAPPWVAFNGLEASRAVAMSLGWPRPALGEQQWTVAGSRVFVLPSSSGAANRGPFAPLTSRLEWWQRLAAELDKAWPATGRPNLGVSSLPAHRLVLRGDVLETHRSRARGGHVRGRFRSFDLRGYRAYPFHRARLRSKSWSPRSSIQRQ